MGVLILKVGLVLYATFACLGISGIQLSSGVILIGIVIMSLQRKKVNFYSEENKNIFIVVFIFILWNFIVSVFGSVPKLSIRKLVEFCGAFLIGLGLLNSKEEGKYDFRKKVIYVLIFFCMIESMYGVLQYFTGVDFVHKTKFSGQRIRGTLGYCNSLGGVLGMMVPFIYANLIFLSSQKIKERIFLGLSLIFSMFALILTFTRGAWAGVAISVFLISFYKFKWKSLLLFLIIPVLLVFAPVRERVKETIDNPEGGREEIWRYSLELIKEKPFTGYGFFSFQEKVRQKDYYIAEYHFHTHNVYLNTMLQSGVVGVLLLILFFLFILRDVVVKNLQFKNNGVILGILGVVLDFYIHGLVDNVLWGETLYMFIFFVGLSLSLKEKEELILF